MNLTQSSRVRRPRWPFSGLTVKIEAVPHRDFLVYASKECERIGRDLADDCGWNDDHVQVLMHLSQELAP